MTSPLSHPLKKAPKGADLVILAKSPNADPSQTPQTTTPATTSTAPNPRAQLFANQRLAARILGRERVGKCYWSIADLDTQVVVVRRKGHARFQGLQTCGSVWACPFCSDRISKVRRQELNDALAQARELGLSPVLITLTARHQSGDDLPALLDALKKAKEHWHNSRTFKAHKPLIAGYITATELTHGANGWHPHFHILMFLRPGVSDTFEADLQAQWLTSLEARGLSGNRRAFELQDASAAGNYVSKWGAAEEMTLSSKKSGDNAKTKGRSPFQILTDAAFSPADKALFYIYAQAFKGRRQLVWSKGLRDLLAVPETSDADAAVIEETDEDETLTNIPAADWPAIRAKGRAPILQACEDAATPADLDAAFAVIEAGPDLES